MSRLYLTNAIEPYGFRHLVRQSYICESSEIILFTPKVAGSSIKRELLRQNGILNFDGDIHQRLRQVNSGVGELGYIGFINSLLYEPLSVNALVRDPLDRIKSAFRDKLLGLQKTKSVSARRSIIAQARAMFSREIFAKWMVSSQENNFEAHDIAVLFEQFVKFLIKTNCYKLDPHFASQFVNLRCDLFTDATYYKLENIELFCANLGLSLSKKDNESIAVSGLGQETLDDKILAQIRHRFQLDYWLYDKAI